jgi:hypothetical protein
MAKSEEHLPHVTYVCGNGNAAADTDDDDDVAVCSLPLASNVKEATGGVVAVFVGTSLLSYSSSGIIISTPYKCCFDDQFTTGDGGDAVEEEGTTAGEVIVLIFASSTAVVVIVVVSPTGVTVENKTVLLLLLPRLKQRLLSLDSDVDMTRTDEKAAQLSHDDDAQKTSIAMTTLLVDIMVLFCCLVAEENEGWVVWVFPAQRRREMNPTMAIRFFVKDFNSRDLSSSRR